MGGHVLRALYAQSTQSPDVLASLRKAASCTTALMLWVKSFVTVGYLSFGHIEKEYVFCDLSVREKDWRG